MEAIMRTILVAVALTAGVTISGVAHAADCSPLRIESSVKMVPLGRTDRTLVPITLNGVEKKFLFNTGGAISTISAATAKELGLPLYHSRYRLLNYQKEDSWDFVQVHEVILGTGKNSGVQLQVVDHFGPPRRTGAIRRGIGLRPLRA
jgi:Aspartyl protease